MSRFSRRELLAAAAAAAVPAVAQRRLTRAGWEAPNVVLIVAENLGDWMCGCYGNRAIQTPNIDLLARMGTRFANCYSVVPAASASRATLYTGKLPSQHGIRDALGSPGQTAPPDSFAGERMISDVLSASGWRCGFAGRWGMGGDGRPGHGYEFTYTLADPLAGYQDPLMARNGERVQERGYLTELITTAANGFLDRQTAGERFFLAIDYPNPRPPYDGHPQRYYDQYAETSFETIGYQPAAENAAYEKEMLADIPGNLRKFAAGISALDGQIAALIAKLREREFWSDTLIVFTAGSGYLLGRHGLWSDGRASDPPNMFEEVMRVPMIWSWPGMIPVEGTRPELVSHHGFASSLLEAARVEVPEGNQFGGRRYRSLAMGGLERDEEPWPTYLYGSYRNTEMVRDGRFKLILRNRGEGPNELYSLVEDPGERRNEYDNASFRVVRNRLADRLAERRRQFPA